MDKVFPAKATYKIQRLLLQCALALSVSVTAQLASTVLTFEEIMGLGVDDILLLDKRTNEPVELIVKGRTVFRGRPAKSDGRYAVVITEKSKIKDTYGIN